MISLLEGRDLCRPDQLNPIIVIFHMSRPGQQQQPSGLVPIISELQPSDETWVMLLPCKLVVVDQEKVSVEQRSLKHFVDASDGFDRWKRHPANGEEESIVHVSTEESYQKPEGEYTDFFFFSCVLQRFFLKLRHPKWCAILDAKHGSIRCWSSCKATTNWIIRRYHG